VVAITGRPFSHYYAKWAAYPEGTVLAAGVDMPRAILHGRIEGRVRRIMPGLLEETSNLLERGSGSFLTSSQAIGYAEAVACLEGSITKDEAAARTVRRTKALARRQMAWLRRDPRIRWFGAGEDGAIGVVEQLIAYLRSGRREAMAGASRQEA
jgi:tRNA dimethylallyltransferase